MGDTQERRGKSAEVLTGEEEIWCAREDLNLHPA